MASVEVHLFATLRRYAGGRRCVRLEIAAPASVGHVLRQLGVPLEQARIVFVDHRGAELATPLDGGERVSVFPPIGGG